MCPVDKLESLFHLSKFNRKICEKHVNELAEAIQRENLLEVNPIVINQSNEIISGQHRWSAAKKLKVPLYYIKHYFKQDSNFILTSNSEQRRSTMPDSIKYYSEVSGKREYKELKELLDLTKISVGSLCALLGNNVTKQYSREINSGNFHFESDPIKIKEYIDKYMELKSFLNRMDLKVKSTIAGVPFCKGLNKFLEHKIDWESFMHRVSVDWKDLDIVLVKYEDWYNRFKKVYAKRSSKNKLD
jgi:hypothetical protein